MTTLDIIVDADPATVTAGGTDAPASDTSESLTVTSSGWPSITSGEIIRVIDAVDIGLLTGYEVMTVTAISGTDWTVTRGTDGTTPHTHAAGWIMVPALTSEALDGRYPAFYDEDQNLILPGGVLLNNGVLGLNNTLHLYAEPVTTEDYTLGEDGEPIYALQTGASAPVLVAVTAAQIAFWVLNETADAQVFTTADSSLINGESSYTLAAGAAVMFWCDGSAWWVLSATGAGGGGNVTSLGVFSYNAASNYAADASGGAAVDATNLSYSFTIPASGNVLARITMSIDNAASEGTGVYLGVGFSVHGSDTVVKSLIIDQVGSTPDAGYSRYVTVSMLITGLTPGAAQWDLWAETGTFEAYFLGEDAEYPFLVELYAA